MIIILSERAHELSLLESYELYLKELKKQKDQYKEQNLKQLAGCIARHPESEKIIISIINYLKKDLSKLEMKDVSFLLKLLRKYIEREHTDSNNIPIYNWEDVNIADLKKIEKIQEIYQENGLTELLYSFLGINDAKVFRETLLLSLAYMYGGHIEIQKEFFELIVDDDENKVLSDLGNKLEKIWGSFREKEMDRVQHIYKQVQINLFSHFKGMRSQEEIHEEELPVKAYACDIEDKYKRDAEEDPQNQKFMLILFFLQSLCEGQYTDMQLFLKEQKWQGVLYPNSFDFVSFLRQAVNSYHKVMSRYNLVVGIKILELINELIQGEVYSNIAVFLQKTFLYDMCKIITDYNSRYHTLPRGFGLDPFEENFRTLKARVIFVLKIMLENRDENNKKLLSQYLDIVGLMKSFESLMDHFLTKNNLHDQLSNVNEFVMSLSNEDFKETLGDALNIYIIFRYLWEDASEFQHNMKELIDEMDKKSHDMLERMIFTICKRLVNSVEIIVETKKESLMKIWFPVIGFCYHLPDDAKENFVHNVDRSNSQTKISGLMDSTGEFIPQMKTEYKARKRVIGFNPKLLYKICRLVTNAIGIIVVLLNLATYNRIPTIVKDNEEVKEGEYQIDSAVRIETFLNLVQILLAGSLVVLWYLLFRQRHFSLMWEHYVEDNIKSFGILPSAIKNKLDEEQYEELNENDCRLVMMLKGVNSDEFKKIKLKVPEFKKIKRKVFFLDASFLLNSRAFIWHSIYLFITIGSLFHPIIAIFQVFDIAIRSDTIKQISSAISKNINQFLWTLFLLLVVNIVYSSIGFFFLNDQFVVDSNNLCDNAFSCFINTVNLGLRSGGGIADAIGSVPYSSDNVGIFLARAIFDLSFFIIIIILLLNLIFGMIIDAFGDLRDQKTNNNEDQINVCFICGIERAAFEKHLDFEEHTKEEHNLWSYVYYLVYLLERQQTAKVEMTDIETAVLTKYLQKDLSWMPIGKSLSLERIYSKEKQTKENEFEIILREIKTIQNQVVDIDTKVCQRIN